MTAIIEDITFDALAVLMKRYGVLNIKPDGELGYAHMISLEGRVTETHIDFQIKEWIKLTLKSKEFIEDSKIGVAKLKNKLDVIFRSKNL